MKGKQTEAESTVRDNMIFRNTSTNRNVYRFLSAVIVLGLLAFAFQLYAGSPERAWLAYLVNFLLWSSIAQGGLLFSAITHITKSKWSGQLSDISESFAGFFPVSFILFLLLFLGRDHVFPWLHHDLQGKEVWLNIPFLFTRDVVGLIVLYGAGFVYLFFSLELKMAAATGENTQGHIPFFLKKRWKNKTFDHERILKRKTFMSVIYILAFTLVLSLTGFDLVMSMNTHWISTLFGAYTFVKAFYSGLGAIIVLASILHIHRIKGIEIKDSQFHDIGKLFFGFCLLWADFFYVQLVVIWYGNLPEETGYLIIRTMHYPWKAVAWTVFAMCFIIPFFVLLNRAVKSKPLYMTILGSIIIIGLWLEHILLLGPELLHDPGMIPLGLTEGLMFLGFMGLMAFSVLFYLDRVPVFTSDVHEKESC